MTEPAEMASTTPRKLDWIERNWKWLIPLLAVVALAGFAVFTLGVMAFMKSSDAYRGGVAKAKAAPSVIAMLGTPIVEGILVTGGISMRNESGNAFLSVPLSGPKGEAKAHIKAVRRDGEWHFERIVVQIEKGRTIDVLLESASLGNYAGRLFC